MELDQEPKASESQNRYGITAATKTVATANTAASAIVSQRSVRSIQTGSAISRHDNDRSCSESERAPGERDRTRR
jgi:hypothetical protein